MLFFSENLGERFRPYVASKGVKICLKIEIKVNRIYGEIMGLSWNSRNTYKKLSVVGSDIIMGIKLLAMDIRFEFYARLTPNLTF